VDVLGTVFPHPDFGGDGQDIVAGQHPACRTQAVTVEQAGGIAPVGQYDAGRAVPRLHMHGVEFVEGAQILVGGIDVLPGRRHQQAQRAEQADAAHQQAFEHIVQAHRVRPVGLHDGAHALHVQMRRLHDALARARPVTVALHGVDFAVVGQEAERLGQLPLRPGIGRETLVEHRQAGGEAFVLQVEEEMRQVLRRHQPLVRQGVRRQRRQIERRVVSGAGLLGLAAPHVQATLEGQLVHAERTVDENLHDRGQRLERILAAGGTVDRNDAEAGDVQFLRFEQGAQTLQAGLADGRVGTVEYQTGGIDRLECDAGFGGHCAQEAVGFLEQQPAAIARLAVGGNGAAVREPRQRSDRGLDDPVAGFVVKLRDQTEAAAVLFKVLAV